MSHAEYRWLLIDDIVNVFNKHSEYVFILSEGIYIGKSISRWFSLGIGWIHIGIPTYIVINR